MTKGSDRLRLDLPRTRAEWIAEPVAGFGLVLMLAAYFVAALRAR
ncbi:MAG: hypothetical protein ACKVWV_11705 [Planctomycetota bacterium]